MSYRALSQQASWLGWPTPCVARMQESALWMGLPIPTAVQQLSDEALDEMMLDAQDELIEGLVEVNASGFNVCF